MKPHQIALAALLAMSSHPAAHAATLIACTEANPDALNAALTSSITSYDIAEQYGDRLVEVSTDGGRLVPGLAESWSTSADGLHVTFKLRHNVSFQSNAAFKPSRDFNADDVVFTYGRMLDKANSYNKIGGGSYPISTAFLEPVVQAVRKLDDYTVVFDLKRPSTSLVGNLTLQPFNISSAEYAAALEKGGKQDQLDLAPIGTGPFELVQYQKDSLVRFRAFAKFWGNGGVMPERAAKVDALVFSIVPDAAVRFAKLRENECQIVKSPDPADIPAMRKTAGITVVEGDAPVVNTLLYKVDRKPFDDRRVREALSIAIDLPSLVKAVYQESGTPRVALIPASVWGSNQDLKPRPYDPARAKALLAEAGYRNGFRTEIWAFPVVRAYNPNARRAAEIIQADWAKIGVDAKIVSYEMGEYLRRIFHGDGDVVMLGGILGAPEPYQVLEAYTCDEVATNRNLTHWCNKQFDTLSTQSDTITDQAQRVRDVEQAQQIFYDDIPAITFAEVKGYGAVRSNVQGFKLQVFGGQPFGGISLAP